jgi:predicted unusual protein kinase regulating ubiquinone biosynthesis (AarF/ABC1/UbiB family)
MLLELQSLHCDPRRVNIFSSIVKCYSSITVSLITMSHPTLVVAPLISKLVGNLLRRTDGTLCILDFGMTLDVNPTLRYSLLGLWLT